MAGRWSAPRVVIGVSGGADSLALAAGAAWAWRHRDRSSLPMPELAVTIVDHGLQVESAATAASAREQVVGLGLAAHVVAVTVARAGAGGPEAAARAARYQALASSAGRRGLIMVGHNLDDQAEQVLLGLARGSGARSLAGMATVAPAPTPPGQPTNHDQLVLRPLLDLTREQVRRACAEWGLTAWDDPHNQRRDFARVRVRQTVMPALEQELGPGVAEALARTARLARADADALDAWAEREYGAAVTQAGLDCAALADLPPAVASRVVRRWLLLVGARQPGSDHIDQVMALVTDWHGQGPVHLPGVAVGRVGRHLLANPSPDRDRLG